MNFDQIKVIGFDLDQTLYPKSPEIDSAIQQYIFKKISEHKNCDLSEAENLFKNLYKDGAGLSGRQTLIALEIPNAAEVVQEALEKADISKFLIPDLETINLINALKAKYNYLDLITGSDNDIALEKLSKLNISKDNFNHLICSASKSQGDAYRLWMEYYKDFNFQPNEFLYIGDRANTDFVVPNELGMNAILVNIRKPDECLDCLQFDSLLKLKEVLKV